MVLLLAVPVFGAVALMHRYLQLYAPSNLLVRRVRLAVPRVRTAAVLLALGAILLVAMHVAAKAVAAGAPGWLNVLVLVLAWDAVKVGWLALGVTARLLLRSALVGAQLAHGAIQRFAGSSSRTDPARR